MTQNRRREVKREHPKTYPPNPLPVNPSLPGRGLA